MICIKPASRTNVGAICVSGQQIPSNGRQTSFRNWIDEMAACPTILTKGYNIFSIEVNAEDATGVVLL